MYFIQEVAKLSGVSIRTLHYYDEIGLLSPKKLENSYRCYSQEDIDILQQILSYKYLGFSLKEIQTFISKKEPDLSVLEKQLELLYKEKTRLTTIIQTLERTILYKKGALPMTNEQKFKGFHVEDHRHFYEEAVVKYGKDIVELKQKGKESELVNQLNQIFSTLSSYKRENIAVDDGAVQQNVAKLLQTIRQYSFDCSLEVFREIGLMYVQDSRFKANIDQFGDHTAQYIADAIQYYVNHA